MNQELQILIVNDDSINSNGIRHLVDAVKDLGKITVVAPEKEQSGMGHAISISNILRLNLTNKIPNATSYECNGTPADCVKLALSEVFQSPPDICLSGINHGYNHSINVFYSGTMGAAIEARIMGIPSIGFSNGGHDQEADFSEIKQYVKKIVSQIIQHKNTQNNLLLNVNFPLLLNTKKIKGIKICKQSSGYFESKNIKRFNQYQQAYYWLAGKLKINNDDKDNDVAALQDGYISIVPMQLDLTNYELKKTIEQWEF